MAVLTAGPASAAATGTGVAQQPAQAEPVSRDFGYTGGVQVLELPPHVTRIEATVTGAGGGNGQSQVFAGSGTRVHATIPLPAGTSRLYVFVGGEGENGGIARGGDGGWNGGGSAASASAGAGGGGASEIRTSEAISSRLVVAGGGGGGGGGGTGTRGGSGVGGPSGTDPHSLRGSDGQDAVRSLFSCGGRGGGGTSGAGGRGGSNPTLCVGADGAGGGLLVGGRGGFGPLDAGGGGGGGGYYGGGGGAGGGGGSGGGGGGGSSYVIPSAADVSSAVTSQTSSVKISYSADLPTITCVARTEVRIGQSLDNLRRVCTTNAPPDEADMRFEGDLPAGTALFYGEEVQGGPLVAVFGTFPGAVVPGPVRDYPVTAKVYYVGGEPAIAHFTIAVLPRT